MSRNVKRLRRNLFHLYVWQASNYLVPLIVIPYLARTLGVSSYGAFGLALAVTSYGLLLTDWGFNLSAAQKVAWANSDPLKLRALFWDTMLARLMLSALALLALAFTTAAVPMLRAVWPVVAASSLSIVAASFSANFFLQGLQNMGAFAVSSMLGRLAIIPLMLIFVHRPDDVVKAAAIQNGTLLISSIVSIQRASGLVPLYPVRISVRSSLVQIKDGWHQFVASLSVSLYVQANAIFVGLSGGNVQTGLFTGGQRITQAFTQLLTPINMSMFPEINRLMREDPDKAVDVMFKALRFQPIVGAILALALFAFAPLIVPLLLGPQFEAAIPIVRVLSLLPLLASLTTVMGGNILLPLGLKGPYTLCLLLAGVFNLAALAVIATTRGALGGAICAVATEAVLGLLFAVTIYRHRSQIIHMRAGSEA